MTEGVIFDLEGTLVKLPINYEALYQEIKRELRISKVKPLTKTVRGLDDKSRMKVYKLWERAELKAFPKMSAIKEGMKLYKEHSSSARALALVTMQGAAVAKKILSQLNLSFEAVITREISIDRLDQLRQALSKMGLKPCNVLVVGDRESDAKAAKEVGCIFLRVET